MRFGIPPLTSLGPFLAQNGPKNLATRIRIHFLRKKGGVSWKERREVAKI